MIFDTRSSVDTIGLLDVMRGRWVTVVTEETAYRGIIGRAMLGDPCYLVLVDRNRETVKELELNEIDRIEIY